MLIASCKNSYSKFVVNGSCSQVVLPVKIVGEHVTNGYSLRKGTTTKGIAKKRNYGFGMIQLKIKFLG